MQHGEGRGGALAAACFRLLALERYQILPNLTKYVAPSKAKSEAKAGLDNVAAFLPDRYPCMSDKFDNKYRGSKSNSRKN